MGASCRVTMRVILTISTLLILTHSIPNPKKYLIEVMDEADGNISSDYKTTGTSDECQEKQILKKDLVKSPCDDIEWDEKMIESVCNGEQEEEAKKTQKWKN